jgi:ASC-1-like (ASCH) protein
MDKKQLTWSEAIEEVMINNGYFSTLKQLYEEVPKVKIYIGKTPDNTIREKVQRDERFTKIMPGLWALSEYLHKLPRHLNPLIQKSEIEQIEINHALIQGYMIQIGNIKEYSTYSPNKNALFLNEKLGDITSIDKCPSFTYDSVLKYVKNIDVIWFNKRKYPSNVIEVEHTTNFRNSFVKFIELQDFATTMTIVAPKDRREQFEREISRPAFDAIVNKVVFHSYDYVEQSYSALSKLAFLETEAKEPR